MPRYARGLVVVVAMMVIAACARTAPAQVWSPFVFEGNQRYEYQVRTYEYDYDQSPLETREYAYILEIRDLNSLSADGEPLYEVTTATRGPKTASQLAEELQWGGLAALLSGGFMLGNPFEFQMLQQLDFEVGERLSLFGMGRLVVVEEVAVAGRQGLLVRYEAGDASDRRLTSEWIVDPRLPLPLAVRTYLEDGMLGSETTLQKHERF